MRLLLNTLINGAGGGGGTAAAPTGTPPAAPSWRDTIPEDIRNEPSLANIKDVGDLAKGFVNAQKLVGADKFPLPSKNWTESQYAEMWDRLGRPKTADGYKLPDDVKPAEGVPLTEDQLKGAKELFHKVGLNDRQGQEILKFYVESVNGDFAKVMQLKEQNYQRAIDTLKQEWGDKYDTNVHIANQLLRQLGGEELSRYMVESGLGNDPKLIKFFATLGSKMVQEDRSGGRGTGLQLNDQSSAAEEIKRLSGDKDGFWKILNDKSHPGHKEALERWTLLHQQAFPGKHA